MIMNQVEKGQILVYVVDDDASVRKALKRLLLSAGFQVETFQSALDFLAGEHSQLGTCLLLDIHLGGMSGLELQQHLSRTGNRTPVVFITAHDEEATHQKVQETGRPLLRKPFDDSLLIDTIRKAVQI